MLSCAVLLACTRCSSASCGTSDAPGFPWLVSVQDYGGSHLAAGTIISEFWVVTAPSALKQREYLSVVVGIAELDTMEPNHKAAYAVRKVIAHEEYDDLHANDLMLLMTADKIRFSRTVQPICFPSRDPDEAAVSNCTVSGWTGQTHARYPASSSWCRLSIEKMNHCPLRRSASSECGIQIGNDDPSCVETGGGPVSCQVKGKERWLLAGVLSGAQMRLYFPILYTRTSLYSDWISSRTTEAGQPFNPTITIIRSEPHLQSAATEPQPQARKVQDADVVYDYYNADERPRTGGRSSRPNACLMFLIILPVN
ncbi:inactive serine protease 54 [Eleutherodactylus coqui]|uniref:inactive serine protease 54 n=1 Tax=Eleutherodactylus coqui TaxID=57060 RepID=UPI00346321C9